LFPQSLGFRRLFFGNTNKNHPSNHKRPFFVRVAQRFGALFFFSPVAGESQRGGFRFDPSTRGEVY
jgi:hypothetical protein